MNENPSEASRAVAPPRQLKVGAIIATMVVLGLISFLVSRLTGPADPISVFIHTALLWPVLVACYWLAFVMVEPFSAPGTYRHPSGI